MRFAVVDINGAVEKISATWPEFDAAQSVADELNRELGTDSFVAVLHEEAA